MIRSLQGEGSSATILPGPRRVDRGGSTRWLTKNTSKGGEKNVHSHTSADNSFLSRLDSSTRSKYLYMPNGVVLEKNYDQKSYYTSSYYHRKNIQNGYIKNGKNLDFSLYGYMHYGKIYIH